MTLPELLAITAGSVIVACICVAGAVRVKLRYAPVLIFAEIWTLAWGSWRWLRACRLPWLRAAAFIWGRRDSPEPAHCHRCGWGGMPRWLLHTYQPAGDEDVEPVDLCPRCEKDVW